MTAGHNATHGLRAAEVCDLRWDQIDFTGAVLHVRRVKNGITQHRPDRALRQLHRESPSSPIVFVNERESPFTTAGFAPHNRTRRGQRRLELKAHPRHAAPRPGYALAN